MKKIFLLFASSLLLFSCKQSEKVEAQFEFDGAVYRIVNYEKETPVQKLKDFVDISSKSDKTTYYFFYPSDVDVSVFNKEKFNSKDFYKTVVNSKPDFGFYKMVGDQVIYDDAVWILQQASENNTNLHK